jgi:hypothetical protein
LLLVRKCESVKLYGHASIVGRACSAGFGRSFIVALRKRWWSFRSLVMVEFAGQDPPGVNIPHRASDAAASPSQDFDRLAIACRR